MQETTQSTEVDHHTTKLLVGLVAVSLGYLTQLFAVEELGSISAAFWDEGLWAGNIFVGFLFAIGALLLTFNGRDRWEKWLSKVAAICAFGVAMFPCECDRGDQIIPWLHYLFAAVMFAILLVFCVFFFLRARRKKWPQATTRAVIYALCGAGIVASILALAADPLLGGVFSARNPGFVFHAENMGLTSFGIAWLTASRKLPLITRRDERLSVL